MRKAIQKKVDNFQPQIAFSPNGYLQPIANFEYSSGILTVRTPTNGAGFAQASIPSAGTVSYASPVTGYRGGAGSATPLTLAFQAIRLQPQLFFASIKEHKSRWLMDKIFP